MKTTCAEAVIGRTYTTKNHERIRFDGPSRTQAGMFIITDLSRNKPIAAPPGMALFPAEDEGPDVRALAGAPRDVLEPVIATLDEDTLEALGAKDTRPWVTRAILARIEALSKPPIAITAQADVEVEEIPLTPEAADPLASTITPAPVPDATAARAGEPVAT